MTAFVSGVVFAGYCVGALFFLRFWRDTRDRLFLLFSIAFWILAAQRLALAMMDAADENRPYLYVARLIAFSIIIWAIVDKNRSPT